MEHLKTLLETVPHARILDVGTGVGNFVGILLETMGPDAHVIGIDTSAGAIAAARRNFEGETRVDFIVADVLSAPFDDGAFDVVCLSNTLHHLAQRQAVFSAMRRLLRAGGLLIVNEMTSDGLDERQVSHRELHHFAAAIDRSLGLTHDETYPREVIRALLAEAFGFAVTSSWILDFGPQPEPTPADVENLAGTVDRLLARIPDVAARAAFIERGEAVKTYLRTHGYAGAPQLVVVLERI